MHLCKTSDLNASEFAALIDLANSYALEPHRDLGRAAGRTVTILMSKPSLRTRFSLEAATARLGATPMGQYDIDVRGTREPLGDMIRVLAGYTDVVVIRTFAHDSVERAAALNVVPIVNALTDDHHPLQSLADVLTIAQRFGNGSVASVKGLKVAWLGDGNNVCTSICEAAQLAGLEMSVCTPVGYEPPVADVHLEENPHEAVKGADVVMTDVWASMGQEGEADLRASRFEGLRVTSEIMASANPGAVFMHCLPAHRGEEVDASVIDSEASVVIAQAHNRLHTAQAVIATVMGIR